MSKLNNYLIPLLAVALAIIGGYNLYLKNQRDISKYQLADTASRLKQAIEINKSQQDTLAELNRQTELARQYLQDLTLRKERSEQATEQLEQQFKRQQHDIPSVRNWADQPVPNGLY